MTTIPPAVSIKADSMQMMGEVQIPKLIGMGERRVRTQGFDMALAPGAFPFLVEGIPVLAILTLVQITQPTGPVLDSEAELDSRSIAAMRKAQQ